MTQIAKEALEQMPPETRFRPEDAELIARHKDLLLSWTDELVKAFYDSLFAHPPTKKVFREGERPEREKTLEGWWRRTVEGPLDEAYFAWMAKVGLVHVVRGVENPMMLAMASFVADFVEGKTHTAGLPEADPLTEAFYRLSMAVGAVITHGYDRYRALALYNVAGMEPALLERLTVEEAKGMLEAIRKESA
ncbi:protoglobin domain-containing protein [Thermus sp.]|uniref:protoglobin domain-containing protein n=1 Tax=Thermus sp. TaxID=275 RepID=UPI0026086B1F|nr:protoglobin domain-containing protein [Thermus sp.]MCX7850790.1 protoglobin domain-containing protein [Thermus sp.]